MDNCEEEIHEGWPLGLGLQIFNNARGREESPNQLSALLPDSSTLSSSSSSDLETESTGSSFFYEKSMTLGSLIGIKCERGIQRNKKPKVHEKVVDSHKESLNGKFLRGLCGLQQHDMHNKRLGNGNGDGNSNNVDEKCMTSSLAHFLKVERRADANARHEMLYLDMLMNNVSKSNGGGGGAPVVRDGRVVPPNNKEICDDHQGRRSTSLEGYNMSPFPFILPRICGNRAIEDQDSQNYNFVNSSLCKRFSRCFSL